MMGLFQYSIVLTFQIEIITNTLNQMLKRVQHDKKKCVILNLFQNLSLPITILIYEKILSD